MTGSQLKSYRLTVKGIVQGVGFRPFIHRLAEKYRLSGFVRNTTSSVIIEVSAGKRIIDKFISAIRTGKPSAADIQSISVKEVRKKAVRVDFRVIKSFENKGTKLVPPDIRTCPSCMVEFNDAKNRRFHYPFINCTDCGPRFTIIKNTPYDRKNTTMSGFKMCPACQKEYKDINNRRYHAEPNACRVCGPRAWLCDSKGRIIESKNDRVFSKARQLLKHGKILAVKGLGGFHIAVDAANRKAVEALKKRKQRSNKPFAVMADSIETIKKHAFVDSYAEKLLTGSKAPVVLLQNKNNSMIASNTAPGLKHTGFFLPYTPLHSLLFDKSLRALVMTSANIAEEPIQHDNTEAVSTLRGIADYYIFHDRPINIPADDSVIKPYGKNRNIIIRRSRGFVPEPLAVNVKSADVIGAGALLKSSLCVIKAGQAFMSQHIGDLENKKAYRYYTATAENFMRFYGIKPAAIACDLHPDYLSTRFSEEFSSRLKIPLIKVQHHYSHMLSVMAEHNHYKKAIGIIMDGTGYGEDGHTWGGEFLVADFNSYKRAGHIKYLSLPGGDLASKQAFRSGISILYGFLPYAEIQRFYSSFDAGAVLNALRRRINTPLSSGAGRYFDAAASILGICHESTYEAEAPMKLEAAATGIKPSGTYGYSVIKMDNTHIVDFEAVFKQLWKNRRDIKAAANFHLTFASALAETAAMISAETGIKDMVLSGGVFQNTVLLEMLLKKLQKHGFNVLINNKLSPNDSSISFGQAVYAAKRV